MRFAKPSAVTLAIAATGLLALWLFSGSVQTSPTEAPEGFGKSNEQSLVSVQTKWFDAKPYSAHLTLQGQVLPWRSIDIKAQVNGKIEHILAEQGVLVSQGQPLFKLSDEGRSQALAEAKAEVALKQAELAALKKLQSKQLSAQTEKMRLELELAKAESNLTQAELALSYNQPKAPFAGLMDVRYVELGDLVNNQVALTKFVDINTLKVLINVPQQQIGKLALGQDATINLLDGKKLAGKVNFISSAADATRSYHVEIKVNNPEQLRIAGASATVSIALPEMMAQQLSPALLSLDSKGQFGVKIIEADNKVAFINTDLLSADSQGAWVAGLPQRVQIITLGAGFVTVGQNVNAVLEAQ